MKKNAHSSSYDLKAENERLHKKVECLTIDLAKFVQGGENSDKLVGQQDVHITRLFWVLMNIKMPSFTKIYLQIQHINIFSHYML